MASLNLTKQENEFKTLVNKKAEVALEKLDVLLQPIRDWEDTILFWIAVNPLPVVILLQ